MLVFPQELGRREMIGGLALLALVLGLPLSACSTAGSDDGPTEEQRNLFRSVSQLVIPKTGTAGAGDVGVGDFVLLALAHGLEGARKPLSENADPAWTPRRADGSLRHAEWLGAELDRRANGTFIKLDETRQVTTLGELDRDAFAKGADAHPWRTIKGLILTGYYTSEVGGAQELRYELVPGRWDPNLPLKPGDRAFSSDWAAVDFG